MVLFPNAKINLGLYVVEKRSDGFHNIETVFYPVGWKDILEVVPTDQETELIISGNKVEGDSNDNLCLKAYELLAHEYGLGKVKIHLHKCIPTGAGLGGGSSDAAFMIKGLNELFELNLAWGEMHHYAKLIGADCSFFITNKPVYAQRKGDDLEGVKLSLKGYQIIIVHPGIHVNTGEAYKGITPFQPAREITSVISSGMENWKAELKNDFEETIFVKHPEIKAIKEQLYNAGAVYASMSGSGSAVYGLFRKGVPESLSFTGCKVWSGACEI